MVDFKGGFKRFRRRIFGGSAVVVIVDLLFTSVDLLLMFGDMLFIPVSIIFGNVAGNIDSIPQSALEPLVAGLAVLYVSNLLLARLGLFDGQTDGEKA